LIKIKLIYCDESCHLEFDGNDFMVLGAVSCEEDKKEKIFKEIREIKKKNGISPYFEAKWTKISKGNEKLYIELINYFFEEKDLFFRGVMATGKDKLEHKKYNNGSYDLWYYKMYYILLNYVMYPDEQYKVFIDIKDTNGGPRIRELKNVLSNNKYDFKNEVIKNIIQIHSNESEIMQLTDLIIGAIGYNKRELNKKNCDTTKSKIVEIIKQKTSLTLMESTVRFADKFNFFVWKPRKAE
jgi:hypothetical protein